MLVESHSICQEQEDLYTELEVSRMDRATSTCQDDTISWDGNCPCTLFISSSCCYVFINFSFLAGDSIDKLHAEAAEIERRTAELKKKPVTPSASQSSGSLSQQSQQSMPNFNISEDFDFENSPGNSCRNFASFVRGTGARDALRKSLICLSFFPFQHQLR